MSTVIVETLKTHISWYPKDLSNNGQSSIGTVVDRCYNHTMSLISMSSCATIVRLLNAEKYLHVYEGKKTQMEATDRGRYLARALRSTASAHINWCDMWVGRVLNDEWSLI